MPQVDFARVTLRRFFADTAHNADLKAQRDEQPDDSR
jgi:hypothetical protein